MKRVTVVTPTLNSAKYLEATLRSVAAQGSDALEIEHIIMDGGSTDGTGEIVENWEIEKLGNYEIAQTGMSTPHRTTPHSQFRNFAISQFRNYQIKFVQSKDSGPADAINKGFAMSSGEYLCWLNSDDFYAPGALARAVEVLERNPGKAFCFGHCPIVDENGIEIRRNITRFKEFWYPLSCRFVLRVLNYVSQPEMVFRRGADEAAGPLRTDLKAAWDYDLLLRLWRQGGGVRVKRPELAYFRWTPGSISGQNFARQFRESAECAARDTAGRFAPSAVLHRLCAFFIVLCYNRMTGKNK